MFKKILVVGIIILFLGIAIQPSVAADTNIKDGEDDCNLCPKKVSKQQIFTINNILKSINKKSILKPDKLQQDPPFCNFLFIMLGINALIDYFTLAIYHFFEFLPFQILLILYFPIFYYLQNNINKRGYDLYSTAWELGCYWAVFPPKPLERTG
ncbi:MAG: hypothetical protein AYK22_00540 [Thermoplasmatales archaeon SG8-52-3]|nr:MAG: hypothetical protein AYK22_00540 [Thermoplasmatales archaeon SG8-52-3]